MINNTNNQKSNTNERTYVAIDLKSFYASVECVERKLDPLSTNLVVADNSRTDKTICLAVTPSLKAHGISGRARLFEVKQKVREANAKRLSEYQRIYREQHPGCSYKDVPQDFEGTSYLAEELEEKPELGIDFLVATPRMAFYIEYSTRIYDIYLKYIAPEDMHTYSIDEVFMDVTGYLDLYETNAHDLAMKMIRHVLSETGVTATAGIGSNMYLAKIAMDIEAKHREPDKDGVRIAELDEMSYRKSLWNHKPITDFWRVGRGYAKKLAAHGMYTMGDVARCSLGGERDFLNEDLLYKLFGVNAELLIDHAWGWEPCTIKDVKDYRPSTNSMNSGQVLQKPYPYEKAKLIVKEMADQMALDLVKKGLVCDQVGLTINYDIDNLLDEGILEKYDGEITIDYYGRAVPKHAHGVYNFDRPTSSGKLIMEGLLDIFERTINPVLLVRRVTLTANNIKPVDQAETNEPQQMDLFGNISIAEDGSTELDMNKEDRSRELEEEEKIQKTLLEIKKKFGKNAVVKAMNLEKDATAMDRNRQIGGHKE